MSDTPHRRLNALTGEYVLVSPQRSERPWQGHREKTIREVSADPYDANCHLCAGNTRKTGQVNDNYKTTYAFSNDYPALLHDATAEINFQPLLHAEPVQGECRVLCFSPDHHVTLAEMKVDKIQAVVDLWADQVKSLRKWKWIQVFENKGEIMGCSSPHPHGQVWACDVLPNEAVKEDRTQREWFMKKKSPLLLDYARLETEKAERIVAAGEHWLAVVPWWAVWPFEMLIIPRRRQILHLPQVRRAERTDLAGILKEVLTRYDNLFQTSFPYSMGWHGAPSDQDESSGWQLHAHVYPPLLRSASIRKFMVGYELLAEAQRDLTPEQAARCLREIGAAEEKSVDSRRHG